MGSALEGWFEITISLEHKFFPTLGADHLEQARQGTTGPWGKGPGVHEYQTFDARWMADSKTEPDWSTPIVQDQRDIVQVEREHQRGKIGDVVLQAIGVWHRRHTGFPHPHVVRDNTAVVECQGRNELTV